MTTVSAVAATLTTFFMGVLSDRLGKRKIFIAGGYVLWGISVGAFGLASFSNMEVMFGAASAALAVGISMALLDTVMTFFGSTSNDACFNALVTDITVRENRGKVESVLSVLPLVANVVMLFAQMLCGANADLDPEMSIAENAAKTAGGWQLFFLIFGIVVIIVGIASFFLIDDSRLEPRKEGNYWANLFYGFRPSVVKKNGRLYLALLTFMAFNAAVDSFLPYYMVYFQNPVELGGLHHPRPLGGRCHRGRRLHGTARQEESHLPGDGPRPSRIAPPRRRPESRALVRHRRGDDPHERLSRRHGVPRGHHPRLYPERGSRPLPEIYAPNANMFYVAAAFMALAVIPGSFFFFAERKTRQEGPEEKPE